MSIKKLVLALGCAAVLFSSCAKKSGGDETAASATGAFDWKRASGKEITVYMVEHSTTTAINSQLKKFQDLTGIKVNIQVTPEANYFDQVSNALSSRSGTPDLFMSGVYQLWDYSTAGNVEPLDAYIGNQSLTGADYDFADFVPANISALRWDTRSVRAACSRSRSAPNFIRWATTSGRLKKPVLPKFPQPMTNSWPPATNSKIGTGRAPTPSPCAARATGARFTPPT